MPVSSTFNLGLRSNDDYVPDTILVARDDPFFTVHFDMLLAASDNEFGGLFTRDVEPSGYEDDDAPSFILPEPADVLNVVLHTIYGFSCSSYDPTLECLVAAVAALKQYGICLQTHLSQGTPLYNVLLNHVPLRAMEIYAIAGENNLEDLARITSSYTLRYNLGLVPGDLASRIGLKYLHKLYQLHRMRMDTLKEILDVKLYPHVAKPYCSVQQRVITSTAFTMTGIQIYYHATPGESHSILPAHIAHEGDLLSTPRVEYRDSNQRAR